MDKIDTESKEYEDRFLSFLTSKGIDRQIAIQEFLGADVEELSNPESDALDCLSSWEIDV